MDLKTIKQKAKFWCKLLEIEKEWKIEYALVSDKDLIAEDGMQCGGMNDLSPEHQKSLIAITKDESDEDQEFYLVHELLHIPLDGHKQITADTYDTLHERAINKIAHALIGLKNELETAKATKKKK